MSNMKIEYLSNPFLPIIKDKWKGNIVIDGKFYNTNTPEKSPITKLLKWKFSANPQKEEKKKDSYKLGVTLIKDLGTIKDRIVWLGHASFLISIKGVNIIIDPSFFSIPGFERKVEMPCKIEELNNIDFLLVSHDHRDHFDIKSIKEIIKNNSKICALIPLRMAQLFKKNKLNSKEIQEAGWYQEYKISKDIRIVFVPSKHWGRRGVFDFNRVLWGGFIIMYGDKKIFFSGDTSYSDVFKEIHSVFGDMDICLLPIGAYSPAFMMKDSHVSPEEAYQIYKDLKAKIFIPMHYGTFDLSDEPMGEPINRIRDRFKDNVEELVELAVGGEYSLE